LYGHKKSRFPGREPKSISVGHKKAQISGRHLDTVFDGQKKGRFLGQVTIVRPETYPQAARLANTPASRSKQAARATLNGSLRCFVPLVQSLHSISVWVCPPNVPFRGQLQQTQSSSIYLYINPEVATLMRPDIKMPDQLGHDWL